jgi:hypothetical protein
VPTLTLENPVAGTEIEAGLLATNFSDLQTLLNGGLDNSNISASAALDAAARVGVRLNSAGSTFSRRRINFIEGTGIDLTVADDSGNEEVDVTIASTSSNIVYRKVTEKDVVNTVTETDLLNGEITVAAGAMSTNKTVRVSLAGDYLNNTASDQTLTLAIKFGGTTLWADTISSIVSSATRRAFRVVFEITNLNANNVQSMAGVLFGSIGSATTGLGDAATSMTNWNVGGHQATVFGSNGTHALDTSTSKLLELTATHSTNSANLSMRLRSALVEVI